MTGTDFHCGTKVARPIQMNQPIHFLNMATLTKNIFLATYHHKVFFRHNIHNIKCVLERNVQTAPLANRVMIVTFVLAQNVSITILDHTFIFRKG